MVEAMPMHWRRVGLHGGGGVVVYHGGFAADGAKAWKVGDHLRRRPEMKVGRDVLHADAGNKR